MKMIPWKGIAIGCLVAALLIVARCVVTVGKGVYYHYDYLPKLIQDPWFYVGIVAAAVGMGALAALAVQVKKRQQDA